MRIASLDPGLTSLVLQLGAGASLVGISSKCDLGKWEGALPTVLTDPALEGGASGDLVLQEYLSFEPVDIQALRDCSPDIVLAEVTTDIILPGDPLGSGGTETVEHLTQRLRTWLQNDKVKLVAVRPYTLESIYDLYDAVGKALGMGPAARDRAQRLKAQLMNWADNFYERTKNKKVTFLSGLDPLQLGGLWIPDLIALCSAISQERIAGRAHPEVSWDEIVAFHPDVIVVAPQGADLASSLASFKALSAMPNWESIPAVVRGEVIFTDGVKHFYNPASGLIDSMAVLLSAIAGFESGYIADRDTFYRLRWLELHRHRI